MPELPEVETICRGLAPLITGLSVTDVIIREKRLRHEIPSQLAALVAGRRIVSLSRRAKYLLIHLDDNSSLIVHLGMSGTLRYLAESRPYERHDHLDIVFDQGFLLRYRDPRRFGVVFHCQGPPSHHPLLQNLGCEPLSSAFTAEYLYDLSRRRSIAVKLLLMDQRVVVGVGNIYASEALYGAGIAPWLSARDVTLMRYSLLVQSVQSVLRRAIDAGGTTLRDFFSESGSPGYFAQQLEVYGRSGKACRLCGELIAQIELGGRSSFYCPACQK